MDVIELLKAGEIKKLYDALPLNKKSIEYAEEYNNKHDKRLTQVGKRESKTIDNNVVEVNRIPIPFQREIVDTASTFLFGSPLNFSQEKEADQEPDTYNALLGIWAGLRMDTLLLRFCKAVKSETQAAIVYYIKGDGKEGKLRAKVLTNKEGAIHPVFDDFGDMIAFGWSFDSTVNEKEVKTLYFWTAEGEYHYTRTGSDWSLTSSKPNPFEKIPVVYMSQDEPEWWPLKEMIDRYEMSFSKFCDVNDYFAAPMYKIKGAVGTAPKKDDTGKIINLDIVETTSGKIIEADIDVISWDHAPEAVKLELETAKGLIYALSGTPDISFDNVKGIGNISGIALKLMFLSPILKANNSMGDYAEAIDRMINVIKAGMAYLDSGQKTKLEELKVKVQFTSILPDNLQEAIQILTEATAGQPIMSKETAVGQNPLIDNAEEELERIAQEEESQLGGTEVL